MSDNPFRLGSTFYKGCKHKFSYRTRRQARHRLKEMLRKVSSEDAARLNVYKCEHCSFFHIGKRRERKWRHDHDSGPT